MSASWTPLAQWLQNTTLPLPKHLAWCHTTDSYGLRDIIREGQITPQHCPFFKEEVSYFFYGRPAYREVANEPAGLHSRAPVVIILQPNLTEKGYRLYPFDTGAYYTQRYSKWLHPRMSLSNFELACNKNTPPQHVSAFFGSNKKYLELSGNQAKIPCGEPEVESLINLISDASNATADDRRLAMELHLSDSIPFDGSTILALIIPDELRQAKWFERFTEGTGKNIEILDYQYGHQRQALLYQITLEDKAKELQESKELI